VISTENNYCCEITRDKALIYKTALQLIDAIVKDILIMDSKKVEINFFTKENKSARLYIMTQWKLLKHDKEIINNKTTNFNKINESFKQLESKKLTNVEVLNCRMDTALEFDFWIKLVLSSHYTLSDDEPTCISWNLELPGKNLNVGSEVYVNTIELYE
jgi:hypothetical protein